MSKSRQEELVDAMLDEVGEGLTDLELSECIQRAFQSKEPFDSVGVKPRAAGSAYVLMMRRVHHRIFGDEFDNVNHLISWQEANNQEFPRWMVD